MKKKLLFTLILIVGGLLLNTSAAAQSTTFIKIPAGTRITLTDNSEVVAENTICTPAFRQGNSWALIDPASGAIDAYAQGEFPEFQDPLCTSAVQTVQTGDSAQRSQDLSNNIPSSSSFSGMSIGERLAGFTTVPLATAISIGLLILLVGFVPIWENQIERRRTLNSLYLWSIGAMAILSLALYALYNSADGLSYFCFETFEADWCSGLLKTKATITTIQAMGFVMAVGWITYASGTQLDLDGTKRPETKRFPSEKDREIYIRTKMTKEGFRVKNKYEDGMPKDPYALVLQPIKVAARRDRSYIYGKLLIIWVIAQATGIFVFHFKETNFFGPDWADLILIPALFIALLEVKNEHGVNVRGMTMILIMDLAMVFLITLIPLSFIRPLGALAYPAFRHDWKLGSTAKGVI
ncbi:hypothetical protein KJ680_13530, partial [bacterium]|nr:hypothetical protein [bacterium]